MGKLDSISKFISAPVTKWRYQSKLLILDEILKGNADLFKVVLKNLSSNDLTLIEDSLEVLVGISEKKPKLLANYAHLIIKVASRCKHYKIRHCSLLIFQNLSKLHHKHERGRKNISLLCTPVFRTRDAKEIRREWPYHLKYTLGEHESYLIQEICEAFEVTHNKGIKVIFSLMRSLGYRQKKLYWKEIPRKWKDDYGNQGHIYRSEMYIFVHHAINQFIIWCVENYQINEKDWDEIALGLREFDPSFSEQEVACKPGFINFENPNQKAEEWLKQKIDARDIYKRVTLANQWVSLYENTQLRYDDKSFDLHCVTCFLKGKHLPRMKKTEFYPPSYESHNSLFINELPLSAFKNSLIYSSHFNHPRLDLTDILIPSFGSTHFNQYSDNYYLFPSPELFIGLDLIQKKGTLEYYKGRELVIKCLNWKGGYFHISPRYGSENWETAESGTILLIKRKYLKDFLQKNGLSLIAKATVTKRKISSHSGRNEDSSDYSKKNYIHRYLPYKIITT